jgi:hypothetical protein
MYFVSKYQHMNFDEKLSTMGFEWNITPADLGYKAELIDIMNGRKSIVSKVSGIPSVNGAKEILGLMAHKRRLTHK